MSTNHLYYDMKIIDSNCLALRQRNKKTIVFSFNIFLTLLVIGKYQFVLIFYQSGFANQINNQRKFL